MKLWTLQPRSILEEIDQYGSFRCKKERSFNLSKKDSLENKYQWLMMRMEQRIGQKPNGVEFPVWAWHTWEGERRCPDVDSAAFLKRTEDKVLLTLEIPEENVVLTDFDAWQIVLNGGFLTNETEESELKKLEEYIDSLDEEQLSEVIANSWENVFDVSEGIEGGTERGIFIQATFWEIKKEYIVEQQIVARE